MDFTKLFPHRTSFTLKALNKEIFLRPCTLGQFALMEKQIGNVSEILKVPSTENLCKIAYFLMEDKSIFQAKEIESYSMSGVKETISFGGYMEMMTYISNADEQTQMLKAITQSMGIELDKVPKKKGTEAQITSSP